MRKIENTHIQSSELNYAIEGKSDKFQTVWIDRTKTKTTNKHKFKVYLRSDNGYLNAHVVD